VSRQYFALRNAGAICSSLNFPSPTNATPSFSISGKLAGNGMSVVREKTGFRCPDCEEEFRHRANFRIGNIEMAGLFEANPGKC
jgi:hypothetical protein